VVITEVVKQAVVDVGIKEDLTIEAEATMVDMLMLMVMLKLHYHHICSHLPMGD